MKLVQAEIWERVMVYLPCIFLSDFSIMHDFFVITAGPYRCDLRGGVATPYLQDLVEEKVLGKKCTQRVWGAA